MPFHIQKLHENFTTFAFASFPITFQVPHYPVSIIMYHKYWWPYPNNTEPPDHTNRPWLMVPADGLMGKLTPLKVDRPLIFFKEWVGQAHQMNWLTQLNLPWMVGQPVCSFNVYYGSADELAPGKGQGPCAPGLKSTIWPWLCQLGWAWSWHPHFLPTFCHTSI